jgi:polyhydroxyalkanoate synthesis regulator phasin
VLADCVDFTFQKVIDIELHVPIKKRRTNMFEMIQKGLLIGIGLASLTVDKAEALVKELVKKGDVSEKEGKDLVEDLLKKSEEAKKDTEAKMQEMVRKALDKLNVATKSELAKLEERIKKLEQSRVLP